MSIRVPMNMPLRFLIYLAQEYQKLAEQAKESLYGTKRGRNGAEAGVASSDRGLYRTGYFNRISEEIPGGGVRDAIGRIRCEKV